MPFDMVLHMKLCSITALSCITYFVTQKQVAILYSNKKYEVKFPQMERLKRTKAFTHFFLTRFTHFLNLIPGKWPHKSNLIDLTNNWTVFVSKKRFYNRYIVHYICSWFKNCFNFNEKIKYLLNLWNEPNTVGITAL